MTILRVKRPEHFKFNILQKCKKFVFILIKQNTSIIDKPTHCLPMLKSMVKMYKKYFPVNPTADEFAGITVADLRKGYAKSLKPRMHEFETNIRNSFVHSWQKINIH
jgi:hypothetical protein